MDPIATPSFPTEDDPAQRAADIPRQQNRRLGRILYWIAGVAFVVALVEIVAAVNLSSRILLLGAGIAMLVGVFMALSARDLSNNNERRGALMLTIALLTGAAAYTIVLPGGASSLALLPVIIVAVMLPFMKGAAIKRILVASWLTGFALVTLNIIWMPRTGLPDWFTISFRTAGFAAVLALTLGLLAHHHRRLDATLEQARADAHALREAHETLQETDRAKTQFLNSAAHELRTPLTPVLIQVELMRGHPQVRHDERLRRSTDLIERNVKRLKSHVDDLLDIARLQTGPFRLKCELLDLDEVLLDVEETFRDVAESKELRLEVHRPTGIRLFADGPRLIQVFFNLLTNAVKATPAGGRIVVEAETGDRNCTIRIRDTGKGIRHRDLQTLFEPFGQVDMADQKEGLGLGLYISRSIVEAHGGQIEGHSDGPGQGATFSFTVPLHQEQSSFNEQTETPARNDPRVDDPRRPSPRHAPATQTP